MVLGDGNKPPGSMAGGDCSLPERRRAGTRTLLVGLMEQQPRIPSYLYAGIPLPGPVFLASHDM